MTKNFSDKELECKCGCKELPEYRMVEKIQRARDIYSKPMVVTSAKRCKKHNKAAGGALTSSHLSGEAIDIECKPEDRMKMISSMELCGFTRAIIYPSSNFIHFDIDESKTKGCFIYGKDAMKMPTKTEMQLW